MPGSALQQLLPHPGSADKLWLPSPAERAGGLPV